MRSLIFSVTACIVVSLALIGQTAQAPRRTVKLTDGQTLEGRVLNEGFSDLQLLTDDQRVRLLRRADGDRYRAVTSQRDWPTYHGDVNGNRYTTLTQIDKTNVARLAPRWVFPMANVTYVENTPLVVGGIMRAYAMRTHGGRERSDQRRYRAKRKRVRSTR